MFFDHVNYEIFWQIVKNTQFARQKEHSVV